MATVQIVADNSEIVESNVGEKRAARAISHRPDIWGAGFKALVDLYKSLAIQLNPGLLKSDSVGIWYSAHGDKKI